MVFIHSRLIKSKQVRFQIFNTRHVNCYCSLLLFCVREINRFLEIPFRESRKILRVSRNSILDSRKHRGSRIEFRVETVNLHLPGTVRLCLHNVSVERVFKFVGSVPQGDDVKKKDLLVSSLQRISYFSKCQQLSK